MTLSPFLNLIHQLIQANDSYISLNNCIVQQQRTVVTYSQHWNPASASFSESLLLSLSVVSDSLWPHGLQPARLCSPWGFSWQDYWGGLPWPPPGNLPNPGIKSRSPALQVDSYHVNHRGSPRILERVFYPFSRGTSRLRNQTGIELGSPVLQVDSLPAKLPGKLIHMYIHIYAQKSKEGKELFCSWLGLLLWNPDKVEIDKLGFMKR